MKLKRLHVYLMVLVIVVSFLNVKPVHAKPTPGADFKVVRYSEDQGLAVLSPYELYLSRDGKSWRPAGLAQRYVRLTSMVQAGSYTLVAAESGNLFRVSDGGKVQALDTPLDPFGGKVRAIKTMAVGPNDQEVLASPGLGLLVSSNGGESWQAIKDPFWSHPEARQVIGVGFAGDAAVVVTREGVYVRQKGKFEPSNKGLPEIVRPTAVSAESGRVLIALPGQGIYETNNGKSWKRVSLGPNDPLAFIGYTVNGYLASGPFLPLQMSDDKGEKWNRVNDFSAGFVPESSVVFDSGALIIFRGKGLMRLDEGRLSPMELPFHLATVNATLDLPDRQLAGTQAGIFFTEDGGLNWTDASPESLSSPVSVLLQLTDGRILLSSLGSGIFISTDSGVTWGTWNHRLGTANVVRSMVEDKGGVLAATEKGLMWRGFGAGEQWGPSQRGVPRLTVFRLIRSGDQIWCASASGVYLAQTGGVFRIVNGLDGRATSIDEEDGNIIALVKDRILFRDAKGKFHELPQLPGDVLPSVVIFDDSTITVGTSQGLYRLKGKIWETAGNWKYPVQNLIRDSAGIRVITRGSGTYRAVQ